MPELHHFPNFPSVIASIYCPYSKLCTLFSNEKIFTYSLAFHFLNRQSVWDSKLYILDVATKLQSLINLAQRTLKANWRKENLTQTNLKEADVREGIFLRFTSLTLISGKLETATQEEKKLNWSSESGAFQCTPDVSEVMIVVVFIPGRQLSPTQPLTDSPRVGSGRESGG